MGCPEHYVLTVLDVMYGRNNEHMCPDNGQNKVSEAMAQVSSYWILSQNSKFCGVITIKIDLIYLMMLQAG